MNYLVVMIVDDPDDCPRVLEAWREIGVRGATVFESSGMGRMFGAGLLEDVPLMPRLSDFLEVREVPHRTIFSVVKEEGIIDRMVQEVERLIGDLDDPNTGFMFVVPVIRAFGLNRKG